MIEYERDYWVEVGEYTVGADLLSQGSWSLEEGEVMVSDVDPTFYNFVVFEDDIEVDLGSSFCLIEDTVRTILCNIYWHEVS